MHLKGIMALCLLPPLPLSDHEESTLNHLMLPCHCHTNEGSKTNTPAWSQTWILKPGDKMKFLSISSLSQASSYNDRKQTPWRIICLWIVSLAARIEPSQKSPNLPYSGLCVQSQSSNRSSFSSNLWKEWFAGWVTDALSMDKERVAPTWKIL